MASSSGVFSEDQFLCPICLDVFFQPASIPCGHNFCLPCISSYWDGPQACQCPICKASFQQRPDLKVNTFISELASHFKSLEVTDVCAGVGDQQRAGDGSAVPCDICTDTKKDAVRSCVECLSSYCSVHLEPHYRAAGLKRHTLVEPAAGLEDRICPKHNSLLVSFCRDDNLVLCAVCASSSHTQHRVVPVQQACVEMRRRLASAEDKVQEEIQERINKTQRVKESLRQRKAETEELIASSEQEITELKVNVVRAMKERQKANQEHADGFIRDMERETAALQRTAQELRELKRTEDGLVFLQRFSKVTLLPHTMDLSSFSLSTHLELQHIHKSVSNLASQLRALLNQMSSDMKDYSSGACGPNDGALRRAQQHEVNVVLDADTAHPLLVLSEDGKQVRFSADPDLWRRRALNPTTFSEHLAVLGRKGFSSCRFYFEVSVGRKTEFCLGVAAASIPRKTALARTFNSSLWAIWFLKDRFEAFGCPDVPVYRGGATRLGVYVDYNGGEVSFFDVKTEALIYSFTDCDFREKLHPYFNPCDNEYGCNWDPMIIVPVCHAD
ncbi:tripartite motif-containing protein 60-like [Salarias fasciatus]|uniref:Tripartite motif-containing protein 60-like n=1 Tax=Salarias fasciatus TaxID=181472 RepID=A0A672FYM3_SALFA|nr:tripartite motif-containing protein 60-like [Salarias fasciatus]XP_029953801.1 tripartite motif-containing protein 60-like [Salarias fasciatus]